MRGELVAVPIFRTFTQAARVLGDCRRSILTSSSRLASASRRLRSCGLVLCGIARVCKQDQIPGLTGLRNHAYNICCTLLRIPGLTGLRNHAYNIC